MHWDLTKMYSGFDDAKLAADFAQAQALNQELAVLLQEKPADVGALLVQAVRTAQKRSEKMALVGEFIFLNLATNAKNEQALAWMDKLMRAQVEMQQTSSAFMRYVSKVEGLDALIAREPLLKEHEYMLKTMVKDAAHVMDPAIEGPVLKMQMTGGEAWSQLSDQITATHMVEMEIDGEKQSLPLSTVRGMATSPEATVRRRAYEAELASYPRIELAMAACLNGIKGEALTLCELQHYDTVLDTALDAAKIDRQTLDAMLTAMRESLPAFRRYFRAKARHLGHEGGLPFYDLFAPIGAAGKTYTLEEARQLLVQVFGQFSEKMSRFIDRAFEEHWIDAFPYEGKQGGAFCAGVHPLGISYVLANFEGSLDSVSTLAHELGHAYHGDCVKHLSILNADYPMTLAETASIFNETMLVAKLQEGANPQERLMLLDQQIGNAAQVVVDILSRFLFESEVIERRKDHTMLPDELKEIMLDAQKQTYGDGLDENALHPYMWACKTHYYSASLHFYNFPYAFGLLFGLGVYERYLEKGEAFLPEYDALLAATGLGDVKDVAARVGIDVTDVNFWRKSLSVVEKMIDEMEKLA
ncbi:MAG TPA: M3 family oligoendopeptidase [Candidatus Ornithocaccomicrobium faecavium]|uniref:M3 family oligoendopeptidase n=1 Tax=Candidatus Ornithocaccomicrobium faecavium TaxID=2840890 RepID=A0A9D1TDG5_9FIRM|nr:M3 family oligoendopeptidase [Candidatus Ornithocaccomicrobium faecavium]